MLMLCVDLFLSSVVVSCYRFAQYNDQPVNVYTAHALANEKFIISGTYSASSRINNLSGKANLPANFRQ